MITLEHAYILVGLMFLGFAILTLRDSDHPTRIRSALFWGLIAVSMLLSSRMSTRSPRRTPASIRARASRFAAASQAP